MHYFDNQYAGMNIMDTEKIILYENLEATVNEIEALISKFFFENIIVPLNINLTFEQEGNKKKWVIKPKDRIDGGQENIINGYYEISPMYLAPNSKPVSVKIVCCRDLLVGFWYDLSQFIKSGILVTNFSPNVLITPIRNQSLLKDLLIKDESDAKSPILPFPNQPSSCQIKLPKKQTTINKWREAYAIVVRLRKEYEQQYLDGIAILLVIVPNIRPK